MINKKDAKLKVDQVKGTMAHLIGVPVLICLGPHEFEMVLSDVKLASISELALLPDKVYNAENGKQSTPQVMQFLFLTGESISIVLDDITDFSVGITGAMFKIGEEEFRIVYSSQNKG